MLPAPTPRKRERPRGLWKARVMPLDRRPATNAHERKPPGLESDNDDDGSSSPESLKPLRHSSSLESLTDIDQIYYWDYSRSCSPNPDRVSSWKSLQKKMDVSSIAGPGNSPEKPSWTYDDWEDLKDLFVQATDQFENAGASEALPIIRGVIHECHRFMLVYPDPSVLLLNPPPKHHLSGTTSPPDEAIASVLLSSLPPKPHKCKCADLPTAFHLILGTVLFMFGSLIDQDPTQAAPGEPDTPLPYWLAALDVFETGENLPIRTSGYGPEVPDDWQMAIVWGRTFVALAEQMVTRQLESHKEGASATYDGATVSEFLAEDPEWPPESPFSVIVRRRPPLTQRMTLSSASPNELMVFAMDQFSRGIFRMPHQVHQAQILPLGAETFSRAKELFQIASDVLSVAEKLMLPTERHFWATWADGIFNQMKMEADMDAWRGPINRARGRCWLVVGTARAEEFEAAMEESDGSLADSKEAREARDGLLKALAFFERAKGSAAANHEELGDEDAQELRKLLAETLLDLGNLAPTKEEQEKYYTRAKEEGGQDYLMDEDSDHELDSDGDELMNDS
ncbi:hypothetical protein C0995_014684 [Termitomyces sp. Mi166|nr:hypothetical protein C0995_014684 [Termitomyces sp. Mi166\